MSVSKNRPLDRPADDQPDAGVGDHDLQRVRDILFGAQQRSTSQQIAALEQRMTEQIARLRQDLLAALGEESATSQRRVAAATAEIQAAWQKGRDALAAELAQKFDELREGKLDREALAGLLGGLATRLGTTERKPR